MDCNARNIDVKSDQLAIVYGISDRLICEQIIIARYLWGFLMLKLTCFLAI